MLKGFSHSAIIFRTLSFSFLDIYKVDPAHKMAGDYSKANKWIKNINIAHKFIHVYSVRFFLLLKYIYSDSCYYFHFYLNKYIVISYLFFYDF